MPVYRRKRLPLDRVVRWSPTQDGYYLVASMLASSREAALLCATQHTLLQVEAHRRERSGGDCFGLLIGGLYECPTQFVRYVLITEAVRAPAVAGGDPAAREAALRALMAAAERRGQVPMGWYRARTRVAPHPAPDDAAVQAALFPEPWQAMLLVEEAGSGRIGAFVRLEPNDLRPYPVPFLELLPTGRVDGPMPPRTAVPWGNYRSSPTAVALPDAELVPRRLAAWRPLGALVDASAWLRRLRAPSAGDVARSRPAAGSAPAQNAADVAPAPRQAVAPVAAGDNAAGPAAGAASPAEAAATPAQGAATPVEAVATLADARPRSADAIVSPADVATRAAEEASVMPAAPPAAPPAPPMAALPERAATPPADATVPAPAPVSRQPVAPPAAERARREDPDATVRIRRPRAAPPVATPEASAVDTPAPSAPPAAAPPAATPPIAASPSAVPDGEPLVPARAARALGDAAAPPPGPTPSGGGEEDAATAASSHTTPPPASPPPVAATVAPAARAERDVPLHPERDVPVHADRPTTPADIERPTPRAADASAGVDASRPLPASGHPSAATRHPPAVGDRPAPSAATPVERPASPADWAAAIRLVDAVAQDDWFVLMVPPREEEVARHRASRRRRRRIGTAAAGAMAVVALGFVAVQRASSPETAAAAAPPRTVAAAPAAAPAEPAPRGRPARPAARSTAAGRVTRTTPPAAPAARRPPPPAPAPARTIASPKPAAPATSAAPAPTARTTPATPAAPARLVAYGDTLTAALDRFDRAAATDTGSANHASACARMREAYESARGAARALDAAHEGAASAPTAAAARRLARGKERIRAMEEWLHASCVP